MAPELLAGKPHTPAVDVYSFGVIMTEVIAQRRHMAGEKPKLPSEFHKESTCPPWLPFPIVAIVKKCLLELPSYRPSFKQLCDELKQHLNKANQQ